ncbi:MAG: hypothetical protein HY616_06155 [Candidatus Rokubacteria bacterium]|nr:hypothetical protein [Candidatus Rokubacteria bacterium]MBI2491971.1 hypothetical protein [Candidatus Rokubacteria bacterium]MBI4254638.1 hypothetical protein [Candidatus Rokubacteria bacterium]
MEEFLRNYGLWILLGVVFIALHRFGMGCGGSHRHEPGSAADQATTGEKDEKEKKPVAHAGHTRGCH